MIASEVAIISCETSGMCIAHVLVDYVFVHTHTRIKVDHLSCMCTSLATCTHVYVWQCKPWRFMKTPQRNKRWGIFSYFTVEHERTASLATKLPSSNVHTWYWMRNLVMGPDKPTILGQLATCVWGYTSISREHTYIQSHEFTHLAARHTKQIN